MATPLAQHKETERSYEGRAFWCAKCAGTTHVTLDLSGSMLTATCEDAGCAFTWKVRAA